ncbi:MAG TPA: hypothetical protein VI168_09525 [Croceibacterium sp.]|jgi:hypothetical protein
MASELFIAAGLACVATALMHSLLGEAWLVGPMVRSRSGVMGRQLSRQVTRFAWHWTSALWLMVAGILISAGLGHAVETWLLVAIGGAHLVLGLLDAVVTRGRHVGWPMLVLVGGLTLLAVMQTR